MLFLAKIIPENIKSEILQKACIKYVNMYTLFSHMLVQSTHAVAFASRHFALHQTTSGCSLIDLVDTYTSALICHFVFIIDISYFTIMLHVWT